jgi:hypothetical protein
MPRFLDLACSCGAEVTDLFVMTIPPRIVHLECGGEMEQVYRPRPKGAQWGDRDAVVVFKKANGSIIYPGRNDKLTPAGCERIVMRSLRAVEQFEREHNVRSHIAHYDSGSGRSADDAPLPSKMPSERERWERFRESTRGIF